MQLGQLSITRAQTFLFLGTIALFLILYYAVKGQTGRVRAYAVYLAAMVGVAGACYWVGQFAPALDRAVNVLKAALALGAASAVFFEMTRERQGRPVAERWKKFIGISMGVAGIVLYFNGFKVGYDKFWHRHDTYHYYMGAKYFPEIRYDGLYKCTVVAMDDLKEITFEENGKTIKINTSAEVRNKEKKIRNLGGDNLLYPALDTLAKSEECRDRFKPPRWEQFKKDIAFFRSQTDKGYWDGFQKDHGYNPPPVWTLAGYILGNLKDANLNYMQFLGSLDIFLILGAFGMLYWAFGWRVTSVAAILWGCQSTAPNYWTLGAFLRQDWFFWFVSAVCFARKRWFKMAGASLVYAALLRIFPGLAVIGWLVVAGAYLFKHKKMRRDHVQTLIGGTLAAAVLIGASVAVVGKESYQQFFQHTIKVHDQTPLTNHVGLRVIVGHRLECLLPGLKSCEGRASGRMKYSQDQKLLDPFETWKKMRNDRWAKYKPIGYGMCALALGVFVLVVRRIKSLWVAQCLGQIWIVLLSQLTSYYYVFIIISAPLTRLRRDLEVWMFGFAALTQFIWLAFGFNDDRYTVLTWVTLIFCQALIFAFAPRSWMPAWMERRLGRTPSTPAAPAKSK